jgi:gamma-glutamyltranspeptidase/glutathione hydrolase
MQPAIQLAEQGFKLSPHLHRGLLAEKYLMNDPVAANYFYDAQGKPHPVGYVLKNPELAAVLRDVAVRGSQALKQGAWPKHWFKKFASIQPALAA